MTTALSICAEMLRGWIDRGPDLVHADLARGLIDRDLRNAGRVAAQRIGVADPERAA
jgi:hypothetical protein